MERFLAEICSPAWNLEQDRGRTWSEATALLAAHHPQHKHLIEAYRSRWHEMLGGPIEGTVAILRDLKDTEVPLFGLTNWSHETFPQALELYDFLGWFQAIIVSGQERLVKPDPRIYRLLTEQVRAGPRQPGVYRRQSGKCRRGDPAWHARHSFHRSGDAPHGAGRAESVTELTSHGPSRRSRCIGYHHPAASGRRRSSVRASSASAPPSRWPARACRWCCAKKGMSAASSPAAIGAGAGKWAAIRASCR